MAVVRCTWADGDIEVSCVFRVVTGAGYKFIDHCFRLPILPGGRSGAEDHLSLELDLPEGLLPRLVQCPPGCGALTCLRSWRRPGWGPGLVLWSHSRIVDLLGWLLVRLCLSLYFSVGGSFWLLYIIFLFVRLFVFVKKKYFSFCYVFVCLFVFCFFLDIFRNIFLAYYWGDKFFNVYIGRSVALIHFEFLSHI